MTGGGGRSPSRSIGFRLAALVVPFVALVGVPELIVRIADPPLGRYTAILFGEDPRSPDLFMRDTRLGWKLRPSVHLAFGGADVRTDRHGFRGAEVAISGKTVLCLGDSTTFGWRTEERDTYPARLDARLRGGDRDGGWAVVNAGVPGYTSLQVRRAAERLIPALRPRAVVICAGNNDGWPARESDASFFERTRRAAAVEEALSRLHVLIWLREHLVPIPAMTIVDPTESGLVPRVARDDFVRNVGAVAQAARDAGAEVVVVAPPTNPYQHPVRSSFGAEEKRRLREGEPILDAIDSNRLDEAFTRIDALVRAKPDDYYALWLRGIALTAAGRVDEGAGVLRAALELHPAPEGMKPSYREALERFATSAGLRYLDANAVLFRALGSERPSDLFIDWCHPTPLGYERLAAALDEALGGRPSISASPTRSGAGAAAGGAP